MNKTQSTIKEIFLLRSIACLSIVLLHAIAIGLNSAQDKSLAVVTYMFFDSIVMILYFGTPLFIFISEFLIAYAYRNKEIPSSFLRKRVTYIFLPFLFMAFFYSLPYMLDSFENWGIKFLANVVIGDFHGYFILIIFQFYVLHLLLHEQLRKWNPKLVLSLSLIINIAYLAFFNFSNPSNSIIAGYIWERFYWVPFLGWIFYFVLGFYCGHFYSSFLSLIKKYRIIVITAPIFSSLILLSLYHLEILAIHSSKRLDIILHTVAIGFFLFYSAHKLKEIPTFLLNISQYSFGIYLLHYFYILMLDTIYQRTDFNLGWIYLLVLFVTSLSLSVISTKYISKSKYGKYIIGKLGKNYRDQRYSTGNKMPLDKKAVSNLTSSS